MKLGVLGALLVLALGTSAAGAAGPSISGEIFRLDLDGRRVNLTHSRFADLHPTLSPNGRRVAFFSERPDPLNELGVFVTDVVTGQVKAIAPRLRFQDTGPLIVWAPDSSRLAVVGVPATGRPDWSTYVVTPGRPPRLLPGVDATVAGWSPDARLLAVGGGDRVQVLDASGRRLWSVPGERAAWSSRSRLAVNSGTRILIYDRKGSEIPRPNDPAISGLSVAWSPNGDRLAVVRSLALEVRDATGQLVFRTPYRGAVADTAARVTWLGNRRVAVAGLRGGPADDWRSLVLDVGSKRTRVVDFDLTAIAHAPDWSRIAIAFRAGDRFAIQIANLDGSERHTIAFVPGCEDPHNGFVESAFPIAFTPDARSVIYESLCPVR